MTLSTEIAAARPEEQREVLERLFVTMHGHLHTSKNHPLVPDLWKRFTAMLDCGAFLSAAEMLVGDDCYIEIHGPRKYLNIPSPSPGRWSARYSKWNHEGDAVGWGETAALALAAAIAKSLEEG